MKTKKLKIFGLLLAASLAVSGLTGCSSQKDDTSTQKKTTEVTETPEETETPDATITTTPEETSAPEEATNTYVPGTLTADSYESQWLNLRFTPPAGMVLSTADEIKAAADAGVDAIEESSDLDLSDTVDSATYEMMAYSTGGFPNVTLSVQDSPIAGLDMNQYIDLFKKSLETTQLGYTFDEATSTVTIAGQEFTALNAALSANGLDVLQTYYCRQQGDKFVGITISYMKDESTDQAAAVLEAFTPYE